MEGYIALYRILLDKPIWRKSTPEQKSILITLLLMANHEENEWEWMGQKFKVFPGQFITSLDSIVNACGKGITIQNVRTALERFEKLEFLTSGATKCGRLITILKWQTYQVELKKGNKGTNKDLTKTSQRPNKDLTPNNNDKNDKKNIYTVEFEKFYSTYPRPEGKARTFKNWNTCLKGNTAEEIIQTAINYKKLVEKENREKQYIKTSANFLGQDEIYKEYLDKPKEQKPIIPFKKVIREHL
jgi:hypothetical protein